MHLRQAIKGLLSTAVLLVAATAVQAQDVVQTTENRPDNDEAAPDNVTIIGRQSDVADIPGSAHVIDQEQLATFMHSDVMRVL